MEARTLLLISAVVNLVVLDRLTVSNINKPTGLVSVCFQTKSVMRQISQISSLVFFSVSVYIYIYTIYCLSLNLTSLTLLLTQGDYVNQGR